jgi:hypothetical protein
MIIRIINKSLVDIAKTNPELISTLKTYSSEIDIDIMGRAWIRKVMGVRAYIPQIKIELGTFIFDKLAEGITHIKTR